jgi:hypothetical protein
LSLKKKMEYAIPFAALAGLFAISVQSKKNKEGFRLTNGSTEDVLPNTDMPNHNFAVDNVQYPLMDANNVLDRTEKLDHDNLYQGRAYTDKFFNVFDPQNQFVGDAAAGAGAADNRNGSNNSEAVYTSLMGVPVDKTYFKHQNMVPYFGSKIRQRQFDPNTSESLLDSKNGTGSQLFTKTEQSPLFKPEDHLQWAYGMPNQNDFMQARVNPSLRMANVKPFEEERVGPGLGLGYTTQGASGFNSGMMDRETWMDRDVDQLRTANNPKAGGAGVYGYEGPADSRIKSMGTSEHMGRMEKNRPEKAFDMGSDRLMTTTGLEKAQTLRSTVVERRVARPETATEYVGVAQSQLSPGNESLDGAYLPSKRQELGEVPVGIAGQTHAVTPILANDYSVKSHKAYKNNRTAQQVGGGAGYFGALSSAIHAAVTPVLDVLRPSRKENTVGNLRVYGDAGSTVPQSYVLNPNDRAPTTVRETTERSKFHMNINANQLGGAYRVTAHQPAVTERAGQSEYYYAGGSSAGGDRRQMRAYDAEYRQRNNDIKAQTIDGRMQQGNMSLLNNKVNIRAYDRSPGLSHVERAPVPSGNSGIHNSTPSVDALGQFTLHTKPGLNLMQQQDRSMDGALLQSQLRGNPYAIASYSSPTTAR